MITQKNPCCWEQAGDHSAIRIARNSLYVEDGAHFDLILFLMILVI